MFSQAQSSMTDDSCYSPTAIKRSKTFDLGDELSLSSESSSDSFDCATPKAVTPFTMHPPTHIFKNAERPLVNDELVKTAPCLPYEFMDDDFMEKDCEMMDDTYERIPPSARIEPRYSFGFDHESSTSERINALLLPSLATSSSDEEEAGSNCSTVGSLPTFTTPKARVNKMAPMHSSNTTKRLYFDKNAEAVTFGALAA